LKKTARGFTLVELLVVIAIIAILAAVVVLIINPLELMKRSRDAARFTDLANLQQAINVAVQESTQAAQYIACNGVAGNCTGNSATDTRVTNGTGWVKVNLGNQKSVSVPTLPIDPMNTAGAVGTGFHYTYCGNGEKWMIEGVLESDQQKAKMTTDGGPSDGLYEVGSDMALTCAY
jgi:prepilin-type N-terminal cleavage/methylation domain-containing protein